MRIKFIVEWWSADIHILCSHFSKDLNKIKQKIYVQPLLIISLLLHLEYQNNFFIKVINLSLLLNWVNGWFTIFVLGINQWTDAHLINWITKLSKQDFPFNNISLKQFHNGILGCVCLSTRFRCFYFTQGIHNLH